MSQRVDKGRSQMLVDEVHASLLNGCQDPIGVESCIMRPLDGLADADILFVNEPVGVENSLQ